MYLQNNVLEDDISFLQVTEGDTEEFMSLRVDKPVVVSTMNNFPTPENPLAKYKFLSFSIERNFDITVSSRQTYSLLDFMGDLGGLYEALKTIFKIMMLPLTNFAYN